MCNMTDPSPTRRRKRALLAAMVLIAVAVLIVLPFLSWHFGFLAAMHYRLTGDQESLYKVMHKYIRSGDSVAKVESLLGSGNRDHPAELVAFAQSMSRRLPQSYPDGVQTGDVFIGWSGMWLQFRDGRLINHVPEEFEEYVPL